MSNRIFYTGTTLDNLRMILTDEEIKVTPPKRVWEEYSKNYVYLLEADEQMEDGEPFEICVEQSSFAIASLGGRKRVVIKIEGINETLLVDDPDGPSGSLAYPMNIPLQCITNIFIEEDERTEKIQQLIAATHCVQRAEINCEELEWRYLESGYDEQEIYRSIEIPNINTIPIQCLVNREELSNFYMDLIEEVDRGVKMCSYTLKDMALVMKL